MTANAPATPASPTSTPDPAARMPRQIPFIIGNEACERFSFYGMRNILVDFLSKSAILAAVAETERGSAAKEVFHIFVMGVYFFPLLGGWLSDRFWGKYRTIFWLSLVYCAGNLSLALFPEEKAGFYLGLFLISLGSGGIKPCVSAFVGEQFDQRNKHLAKVVFDAFYWIINFGSFFASLSIPFVLSKLGPRVAFGIPGVLMLVATLVFWLGRDKYVVEPPSPADPNSFARVARSALARAGALPKLLAAAGALGLVGFVGLGAVDFYRVAFTDQEAILGIAQSVCLGLVLFLSLAGVGLFLGIEAARGHHPDDDVDGVRAVLRVLVLFVPVTAFWSLFDQKASTWVLQGDMMQLPEWAWFTKASQMQSVNPLLVMGLIPLNNLVLYPALRKLGIEPTPLRKMGAGIALAGIAWIVVGLLQLEIEAAKQGGEKIFIGWQVLPYALLTLGEVLVSATGLEFAYSQAPPKMKGVLMSFWSLAVTVGGLWVLLVNSTVKGKSVSDAIAAQGYSTTTFQMFFFAAFAFAAALAFALYALRYQLVDHYRKSTA